MAKFSHKNGAFLKQFWANSYPILNRRWPAAFVFIWVWAILVNPLTTFFQQNWSLFQAKWLFFCTKMTQLWHGNGNFFGPKWRHFWTIMTKFWRKSGQECSQILHKNYKILAWGGCHICWAGVTKSWKDDDDGHLAAGFWWTFCGEILDRLRGGWEIQVPGNLVLGMGNSLLHMFIKNWHTRRAPPVACT